MGRMRRIALVFVVLALAVRGLRCGLRARASEPVTVALDFVPNPVHAPIYMARRRACRSASPAPGRTR